MFSGDDAVTLPLISLGGVGIISVASNQIPREMAEMTRAALANDWTAARRLHRKYLPLMQANFIESNPMPVKAVLAMMGKIERKLSSANGARQTGNPRQTRENRRRSRIAGPGCGSPLTAPG